MHQEDVLLWSQPFLGDVHRAACAVGQLLHLKHRAGVEHLRDAAGGRTQPGRLSCNGCSMLCAACVARRVTRLGLELVPQPLVQRLGEAAGAQLRPVRCSERVCHVVHSSRA